MRIHMNGNLLITGAYGRDASVDDFLKGKDFKIVGGPYMSIRDVRDILDGSNIIAAITNNGEPLFIVRKRNDDYYMTIQLSL